MERSHKKDSWTIASSSFLDFEKKNLCFYRKVFSRVVKTTFYVSRGTLTEQHFWKEACKNWGFLHIFRNFRENGEKHCSGLEKQQEKSRGTVYGKTVFKREKIAFFPILSDFLLLAKKFGRFAKPAIYVSVEVFVEKHFLKSFSIFSNFSHFFGVWSNRPLVGKFLFGLSQLQSAILEALFGYYWAFFMSFNQKIRVSKSWPTSTEKNWRKKFVEKLFFQVIFGLRAEKFEQLNRKFTQDCQNYVQRLQRDDFGTFLWNEGNLLKLFGPRWAKLFAFWRENFSKFVKKAAYVSSGTLTEQHFWKEAYKIWGFSNIFQNFRENGKKHFSGLEKQQ